MLRVLLSTTASRKMEIKISFVFFFGVNHKMLYIQCHFIAFPCSFTTLPIFFFSFIFVFLLFFVFVLVDDVFAVVAFI